MDSFLTFKSSVICLIRSSGIIISDDECNSETIMQYKWECLFPFKVGIDTIELLYLI